MKQTQKKGLVCGLALVSLFSATTVMAEDKVVVPMSQSEGTADQQMPNRGKPLNELTISADQATPTQPAALQTTFSYYHIPGSVLKPVDIATQLHYNGSGCVSVTAGASYLLNAPLVIPPGSKIAYLRLYYNDTSGSDMQSWITRYEAGGASVEDLAYVNSSGTAGSGTALSSLIDHTVDTYDWSYVLNARLNVTTGMQVCGMRVAYYAPITEKKAVFFPIVSGQ